MNCLLVLSEWLGESEARTGQMARGEGIVEILFVLDQVQCSGLKFGARLQKNGNQVRNFHPRGRWPG